jgi:ankyrin repeat domain-containing protein 50
LSCYCPIKLITRISSSVVIDYLRKKFHGQTVGIGCIFCNHKEQQDQTASYLISSLLKQFIEEQKDFPAEVTALYKTHKKYQTRPSFSEYSTLLQSVVTVFSKVFIVIDALDECTESGNTRRSIIDATKSLLSKEAHIMVTSRKLPQIESLCKEWLQVEIRAKDQDIWLYLDAHIEDESELVDVIQDNPEIRNHIIKTIVQKSQGM